MPRRGDKATAPPPPPKPVPPGSYASAVIILLTDGQRTTGPDSLMAAKMAAERGVRVYTVGVGTPEGKIIGFEGWSMRVRLDEETLKEIAKITNAEYFYAGNAVDLNKVYQALNAKLVLERKKTEITALSERIKNVARRVAKWKAAGHDLVVVPSAMAGETNRLIALAKELQPTARPARARRRRLHRRAGDDRPAVDGADGARRQGAQLHRLAGEGAHRFGLHQGAHRLHRRENDPERPEGSGVVVVVAGFQGVDEQGNITTLGRGGSDTSAVALAAALKADECQIYTDVDGVYTTDPRLVPEARRLARITFEEMLEMARRRLQGAADPLGRVRRQVQVPTRVLSSLTDRRLPVAEEARSGTLITFEEDPHMAMEKAVISGVRSTATRRRSPCTTCPTARASPTPSSADRRRQHRRRRHRAERRPRRHDRHDLHRAPQRLRQGGEDPEGQVKPHIKCREVSGDERIAKVSIVGMGMRSHAGIAAQMFRTLAEEGINIQMISTSEIKITVVIEEKYTELAVRVLHKAFELRSGRRRRPHG